jgi:hypothetical protein
LHNSVIDRRDGVQVQKRTGWVLLWENRSRAEKWLVAGVLASGMHGPCADFPGAGQKSSGIEAPAPEPSV